jgi:ABC-type antimicrobial peptide transport system permease subunit
MPVLATVVVVSLGVGIGVNTAVFSWLQAIVLRPMPGVADARASVSQRTTEIGVRLAMGATSGAVVAQIVRETLRVIAAGAFVAWTAALLVKLHLVPGPISLAVFAGIPLVLFAVAAIAAWIPARRASRGDVMVALRQQ